jgi:alkylation response protein AidB-like acyl-CoA dehydrogenase
MDFAYTPEEEAFRQELRTWLEEHLPPEWKRGWRPPEGSAEEAAFLRQWQRTLYEGGWAGVSWPKEYGGRGATLIEQVIYQEEMARADAPRQLNTIGIGMVGPTLIAIGTEEQKRRYVPKILNGDEVWCQGYSEPNAGSDLASLRTRAVLEGDRWIINGQKIWTSNAHLADMCFLLCRTMDNPPNKHAGLTCLLVDMHQPGVSVRPIHQMNDHRDFNETYFTNAVAPRDAVVGEVNDGWRVAILLLSFERVSSATRVFTLNQTYDRLVEYCRTHTRGGVPLIEHPDVRRKLAAYNGRVRAARLNFYRHLTRQLKTGRPGPEGSIDKLYASELAKELLGFAVDLLGPEGALWPESEGEPTWQERYLSSFGGTIAAGSSEIQKNIIAERILGLPKDSKE